jgi:anhydro-N-acetylmuramic acid kinase
MRVIGLMSGTSLDGIDAAIVDIRGRRFKTLAAHYVPYPPTVRAALLGISNTMTHTAAISRLNFLLGELYAEAILETCKLKRVSLKSIDLCGMHGQTIFHEGSPIDYLGRSISSTLQIGEAAVVAERTGLHVISNFRERDIAAGGKGAPLVPYVDWLLFRDGKKNRVALNIGGIANITALPKRCALDEVVAFDTGPGNMVIDALTAHMTGGKQTYDRDGKIGRSGKINLDLLEAMLSDPYLKLKPPKTTGREQFGQPFASGLIATGVPLPDLIATATEFTARSIALAIKNADEIIVSGGGVHNKWLMKRLSSHLKRASIESTAKYGIDPDAKEAIAFAILAYESYSRRPASVPSATGARRAVLLGKHTSV